MTYTVGIDFIDRHGTTATEYHSKRTKKFSDTFFKGLIYDTAKPGNNKIINSVPMARMGTEKDIVDAAIYLSEAEYVTGQILNIDGGKSL